MLENVWVENEYTAQGRIDHEYAHTASSQLRGDSIKIFGMAVSSSRLGISGKCDCLEGVASENGIKLPWADKRFELFPVEYKHGRVRSEKEYLTQLCAQAICLEEMSGGAISKGYIYYTSDHRRLEICFSENLRSQVDQGALDLHHMMQAGIIPCAVNSPKCKKCSLYDLCMPQTKKSARQYCKEALDYAAGCDGK